MGEELRILIVDDEPELAEILKEQLEELYGAEVAAFPNANDAYNYLIARRTKKDRIHLIVSDLRMPKVTGLEFLRKVRKNEFFKDIPFVVVSAFGEENVLREAVALEVSDFIVKPYDTKLLDTKLSHLIQKIRDAQTSG